MPIHPEDYEKMEARYGEEDFESAVENAVDSRETRDEENITDREDSLSRIPDVSLRNA